MISDIDFLINKSDLNKVENRLTNKVILTSLTIGFGRLNIHQNI